jgi:ComF family protein
LKYKGNRDAGHFLGVELGKSLKNAPLFNDIDFIVPVPLHPKREQKRGYNQSEVIARGMQEVLGTPLITDNLVRAVATTTQTKKSRQARWENVKDIFVLRNPDQFTNKHILLIDDVITTGSTLEACGLKLKSQTNLRLSIATAACAIS